MLPLWRFLCLLCGMILIGDQKLWGQTPTTRPKDVEQKAHLLRCTQDEAVQKALQQLEQDGTYDLEKLPHKVQQEGGGGRAVHGVRHWDLVTRWKKGSTFYKAAAQFANEVRSASNGCLDIRVYANEDQYKGGKQVKDFGEIYDMVSRGEAPMGHSTTYYRAGAEGGCNGCEFLTTVPFGMTAKGHTAWLVHGGGIALWEQIYNPSVKFFPMGTSGLQMGGWFKKPIKTVTDFRGLNMRIPGIGADVLEMAGVMPNRKLLETELLDACRNGSIDAAEWVGPHEDQDLRLFECFKVYHSPGWHEPATTLGLLINKNAWQDLPEHLQALIRVTSGYLHQDLYAHLEKANAEALNALDKMKDLEISPFPADVMQKLKEFTEQVLKKRSDDTKFKKMYDHYKAFSDKSMAWSVIYSDYEYQRTYTNRKTKERAAIVEILKQDKKIVVVDDPQAESAITVRFEDTFETGKYVVKDSFNFLIEKVADILRKYPPASILIEGHTDGRGEPLANLELSERRANAIQAILIHNKIDKSLITVVPYGSSKCIQHAQDQAWTTRLKACQDRSQTKEEQEKNRRVEMKIILK